MATKDTPRTPVHDDETRRAIEWLFGDDTGLSSRTIAGVMLRLAPAQIQHASIPHDGGDLGRCLRLLEKLPEWRARLDEVAVAFPQWQPVIDHWSELEGLYAEEAGENAESGTPGCQQRMDRTYQRISELIAW